MDNTQIIMTYEEILSTTNKMLVAAKNNEWDQLVTLEQDCRKLTAQLITNNTKQELGLSDELQEQKVKIIHQVLANDAHIRAITEPWMAKLQQILNTTKHERNLQKAYQTDNII